MDWVTWINTGVGIIGIIVGIIGIIVGIIGWKSLSTAVKIKNSIKTGDASNIQQAQIIHNGLDDYAVIRLSRETTREELERVLEEITEITEEDINKLFEERIQPTNDKIESLEAEISSIPRIDIHFEENDGGGQTLVIDGGNASGGKSFTDTEWVDNKLSEI